MDKLDEGRSRLIKSGGFFDEEFIIRLYMEMLVFMSCFGKTGGFRTLLLERRDCLATTRLMSLHVGKGQTAGDAVKRALGYIKDPTKTENGILVTSYGCTPQTAEAEFMLMRREYLTITGRRRGKDDVLAYHLRQSFKPGEITPEKANRISCELAKRFTHGNHAFIVATHNNTNAIHSHIIFSAVNLDCDRKFRDFLGSGRALGRLSDTLCVENGLSIIEKPQHTTLTYDKWLGDRAKQSQREEMRATIDGIMRQKPESFDALLSVLKEKGWEIKRGKRMSARAPGQVRFKRLDSLGEEYSEKVLRAALDEKLEWKPKERRKGQKPKIEHTSVSLLVDVQAKLQQGKGGGYARWAKVFNAKQMAQTLTYLSEHHIQNLADLAEKTEAATLRHSDLLKKVKNEEARMKEITELKKHVLGYLRTRETYAAYKKSGYVKKFLVEHEQEILIHRAAKQAFDKRKLTKLPTVQMLQTEYEALMTQRKKDYAEYRAAKNEMRELLTIRANVERILNEPMEHGNDAAQKKQAR